MQKEKTPQMLEVIINFHETHPKEFFRFIKFSIVGAVGAVIDFTLLNLSLYVIEYVLGWNLLPQINGNLLLANTISVSAAILSNFTWNRLWTFPESRQRPLLPQLGQFALVNVAGLAINQAIFLGLDRFVLGEAGLLAPQLANLAATLGLTHFTLAYNLAKAIAIVIVLFWNFGANRLWTYRGL